MKKPHQWNNDHSDDATYAFNRALKYLSLRARSKKEIEEYLAKKKFEQEAISQAIEKLLALKFLNDEVYGESFTRTRQEYKGKSKYFIKYELQQKGLDQEVIDKVLSNSQEDLQTAKDFITRKKRIYTSLDKKEFKEKMIRLLTSRGFSWNIIKKALED
ncbi:MAG: regulatory protein RecX [Candidatus Levyibacteriota bacterium]